jgi:hypothetical protein
MKITQHKNGSCDFEFDDKEVEVIVKLGKIVFTPDGLKNFSKDLFDLSHYSIKKLDSSLQNLQSNIDDPINPQKKD